MFEVKEDKWYKYKVKLNIVLEMKWLVFFGLLLFFTMEVVVEGKVLLCEWL